MIAFFGKHSESGQAVVCSTLLLGVVDHDAAACSDAALFSLWALSSSSPSRLFIYATHSPAIYRTPLLAIRVDFATSSSLAVDERGG